MIAISRLDEAISNGDHLDRTIDNSHASFGCKN